jgi:hypothetical protein
MMNNLVRYFVCYGRNSLITLLDPRRFLQGFIFSEKGTLLRKQISINIQKSGKNGIKFTK